MRILITSIGSYGDVYPFIAIAQELKRRDHDVILFINEHYKPHAAAAGLNAVSVWSADVYDRAIRHPMAWDQKRGIRYLLNTLSSHITDIYEILDKYFVPGETLIIGSTLAFSSRILQDKYNVPGVTVHLSPSVLRSSYESPLITDNHHINRIPKTIKRGLWWLVDTLVADPTIKPQINKLRTFLGLKPVKRIFDQWLHSPDLVVGLFPAWFSSPQPDWPPQVVCTAFPLYDEGVGYELPQEIINFIHSGDPPVVFTPGTAMTQGEQFFKESIAACAKLDNKRAILLTRYPEQIPKSLPDNIRHYDYIPLSSLLPHAGVLVHHGGIGTCSQAFKAGVPQLIRPMAYDQFDNANRIIKLGAGLSISTDHYQAAKIATTIEMLLQPQHKKKCQEVSAKFCGDNPIVTTCDLILSVVE